MKRRPTKIELFDGMELYIMWNSMKDADPTLTWPEYNYEDDEETDVTVVSADDFWMYISEKYPTFFYSDPGAYHAGKTENEYNMETAVNDLKAFWQHFIDEHPEYGRLAKMMDRTDYDPLENYDRKEDGGWKDTTDDDATHSMSYAEQNTTTINDPKIKTKTTGSVFGDNSTTAVPDTESVTEPVRAAATDVDTVKTTNDAHIDTSYVEGDVTVTREFDDYRVHGNIGVTTAAQMIEGELKVRERYNLTVRILEAFTKKIFTLRDHVIVNVPVWDE